MDTFFFGLFFRIFKIFNLSGVDNAQVKIIASTKLLMDRRRKPPTWNRSQYKETSNGILIALIIYAIMGLFFGLMIFMIPDLMLAMIIVHSYFIFMLIMTLITDFSNVLLDTSDAQIILPKPVTSRTLLAARTLHIIVYLGQLILAIMIFPLLFAFLKYGVWVGLSALLTTLLTTAIGIFLTYILYGLVLRYTNEQKVKDIIGYFQIFMTMFFAIGYQIIPRIINLGETTFTFKLSWYSYLLPPVWMASLIDAVHSASFNSSHFAMMACAIGVPVLTGFIIVKYLAPYFSKFMSAPDEGGAANENKSIRLAGKKQSWVDRLGKLVCIDGCEQASFIQVWKITGRYKNFKMQFYPGLAYIPVFIFIIFFRNFKDINASFAALPDGNLFLWLLYLSIFSVAFSLSLISYYENYDASWIYQTAPVRHPGALIAGSIKAILLKFFAPVFLLLSAATLMVWGFRTIGDILLAGINSTLVFYIIALLSTHYLPFSQPHNAKEQGGRFIMTLLMLLLIGVIVGLHYLILKVEWLKWAMIPIGFAACWMAQKSIRNLPWKKIVI